MTNRQPTLPARPTRHFSARWYRQRSLEIDRYLYQGEHQMIPFVRGDITYQLASVGNNGLALTTEAETLRLSDEEIRQTARYAVEHLLPDSQQIGEGQP